MIRPSPEYLVMIEESLSTGDEIPEDLLERLCQNEQLCRALLDTPSLVSRALQLQKLEALSLLAGGVADDFNELIVGVLHHADLALRSLPKDAPAREQITQIVAHVRHAAEMGRQLQVYSGRGEFAREPVDLRVVVEEMAHLLRISVTDEHSLSFDLAESLPGIEADATQLRQVVLSLVNHASDALRGGKDSITVAVGVTEFDGKTFNGRNVSGEVPPGVYVYLRVTDSGKGMGEEEQARIFDPFFEARDKEGGLGLATVLGIVRGHGGALSVESAPEKGTTVTAHFPALEDSDSMAVEPPVSSPPWRGSGTVLIVDDEPNARKIAKLFLEEVGFTVLAAEDGQQGLEVFREHSEEVVAVVLDLTMPHMGGEETFQEILKIRDNVPVILSSGYAEQDVAERFVGKPWAGFIQKPYRFAALVFKLKEVM